MKSPFIAGLDLGQTADYTALAILERSGSPLVFDVRFLQRFKLGTPYPLIVEQVTAMMRGQVLHGAQLVVDATGVGAAVVDLLRGLGPIAVSITGGDQAHYEGGRWRVPKRDLVGVTKVLLQNGRLRFAEGLPDTQTLVKELLAFQVKIDPATAHDSYAAWREGVHDDLVLAVALACWWGEKVGTGAKVLTVTTGRGDDCAEYRRHKWLTGVR